MNKGKIEICESRTIDKNSSKIAILFLLFTCTYFCTNPQPPQELQPTGLSGLELARIHCSSCHQYVSPELLSKSIWKDDVLPAMGQRLGIYTGGQRPDSLLEQGRSGSVIREANIYPEHPLLAKEDWSKLIDFYINQAPDTLMYNQDPVVIKSPLKHFKYKETQYSLRPPLTTMVKILPDKRGIVFADTKPGINKLVFVNADLQKDSELNFKTAPVHYSEKSDTLYITTIGKNPFPNDRKDGDLQIVYNDGPGHGFNKSQIILPDLQRPVFVEYSDIDKDGLKDVVVCEFGNHTGQLSWYHNKGEGQYQKSILRSAPGAIHSKVTDLNNDGHQDIIALMSQGQEGLFYYENNGDQTFNERQLLTFSPLNGSQYFELCDFNQDGHLDILYVCGDNADKTPILKEYHGVYIYLNDGHAKFSQAWFFHQNGAYKAIPGDYDLDGDIDIASISFFPDYVDRPEESFVYLENTGDINFIPYSFHQSTMGRWMVMDAADMDGDGDLDIALGSFTYFTPMGDTSGLGQYWINNGPSVSILENTTN